MDLSAIRKVFPNLDDSAVDAMGRVASEKSYGPDAVLCQEGDPGEVFYMVVEGEVAIGRRMGGAAEDLVLGSIGPGGHFGEMSLITGAPRAATVTTSAQTTTLEITKSDFDDLLVSSPAMTHHILEALISMIRETDEKAIAQLSERNEELETAYRRLEEAQADRIAKAALEAQLEVAATAQRSLLPDSLPIVPGLEFGARFEPAKQIGGDFYDVRLREDGHVSLLVADVSDKGAHAALFMAVARTLFLVEQGYGADLQRVAQSMHEGLLGISSYEMFVTALIGALEPETGVFRYVRCGHDEPVLVRKNGETEDLGGAGRFLGMWNDPPPTFEVQEVQLHPGDVLVLFSDGVTDMQNADDEAFGRERAVNVAVENRADHAETIAAKMVEAVAQHRGETEAFDDFTLLVVRVRPE